MKRMVFPFFEISCDASFLCKLRTTIEGEPGFPVNFEKAEKYQRAMVLMSWP